MKTFVAFMTVVFILMAVRAANGPTTTTIANPKPYTDRVR
jgi:hypothetical protein